MTRCKSGPGRNALARAFLLLLIASTIPLPALAQSGGAAVQTPATPDERTSLKLLWSTMAAVDHANRTGNYSVLRDLGTAGFQANNNAATLAGVFAGIRTRNTDLAETLTVTPSWDIAPKIAQNGALRMRGTFPLRPTPIAFDLLFAWEQGAWRLDGVAVQPMPPKP
jgi:hypothetical protein